MIDYDLKRLNDKEFESLAIDLISRVEGKRIERFKPGKDSGVDGRFFESGDREVVIQCKHWVRTGLNGLLRCLANVEVDKVKIIKPSQYILITSVELSRQNKKIIKNIFNPFIKNESDIYGAEDINDLISKYQDVEKKYYKLWLASSNVLRVMLNSAIIGRSESKINEFIHFSPWYVRTGDHDRALEKLDEIGSIIITGEAGIGKTTLANQICLDYLANEFDFCCIESQIAEAESLYARDKKQIFYFDDFLGRNYFEALDPHEDSHVINFIKRVSRDKSKRFILTSRSTILNQGKRLSDLFKSENIDRNEYELKINSLSNIDKAKILYNHIWFGNLSDYHIDELYKDKRYMRIIRHRNYNPRLISFITDKYKIQDIAISDYWIYIKSTLDDPADIWSHVIDNQLDDMARILIRLVVFNGGQIQEDDLLSSFLYVTNELLQIGQPCGPGEFYSAAKLAVGSVLNRVISSQDRSIHYELFNPAVGDYLVNRYGKDYHNLKIIFKSLNTKASLANLFNLLNSEVTDKVTINQIAVELLSECLSGKINRKSTEYTVDLIDFCLKQDVEILNLRNELASWLPNLLLVKEKYFYTSKIADMLTWCLQLNIVKKRNEIFEKILDAFLLDGLDHEDYVSLSRLLAFLGDSVSEQYSEKFKEYALDFWGSMINEEIESQDVLSGFLDYAERDDVENTVYDYVNDRFSEYEILFSDTDVENIVGSCDIDYHIDNNREAASHEYDPIEKPSDRTRLYSSENAAIDDLFDRQ